ncbi:hypothetical protein RIF29_29984 [Crotalaria pallida]|uniref:Uncharacterized protein n=1 Tax=Crotalaria pallida TaxID=3830 RepID=A0AAN9EHV0_CROPI
MSLELSLMSLLFLVNTRVEALFRVYFELRVPESRERSFQSKGVGAVNTDSEFLELALDFDLVFGPCQTCCGRKMEIVDSGEIWKIPVIRFIKNEPKEYQTDATYLMTNSGNVAIVWDMVSWIRSGNVMHTPGVVLDYIPSMVCDTFWERMLVYVASVRDLVFISSGNVVHTLGVVLIIPSMVCYTFWERGAHSGSDAYYPSMVQHYVLGTNVGVPGT